MRIEDSPEPGHSLLELIVGLGLAMIFCAAGFSLEAKCLQQIKFAGTLRKRMADALTWTPRDLDREECIAGVDTYGRGTLACRHGAGEKPESITTVFLLD